MFRPCSGSRRLLPRLLPFAVLAFVAGCTYDPVYTGTGCASDGSCPAGFACDGRFCVPEGEDAGLGEPVDGGDMPRDEQEEPRPGDDPDFTDGTGDPGPADQGSDPGPADEGGDPGSCPGGCPTGEYCDPVAGQCAPCTIDEQCGPECRLCPDESTCQERDGEHCCVGICDADRACQEITCPTGSYVCKAISFTPATYAWALSSVNQPHRCLLSAAPGPLEETGCFNEQTLLFHCPWDGKCADGACVLDPTVERTHNCGEAFGCEGDVQSGRCRLHKQQNEPCRYNFDCESYCCQRAESAVCIAFSASQCKRFQSFYWESFTDYIWTAWADPDPHDITAWSWSHGVPADDCSDDWECDSGNCGGFGRPNKCALPGCLDNTEASTIKAQYFCLTGDHDNHIGRVTNPFPLPESSACGD